MPYIKTRNSSKEIPFYDKNMNIYQAISQLDWVLHNKCIDCKQKCTDCYFNYMDKIATEKILKFLIRATKTIKIKGVKKLNERYK